MAASILTSTLSGTYQTYFSKQLLAHAVNTLQLAKYGLQAKLPTGQGAKTITFIRPEVAVASNVQTLTEGTAISTFRTQSVATIQTPLVQYGEASQISDILSATQLLDFSKVLVTTFGEEAALFCDGLVRAAIANTSTGLTKRYAQGLANFAAVLAATPALGRLTGLDLLDACTFLRTSLAPTINGQYVAVVAPAGLRDIMDDNRWLQGAQYSDIQKQEKGEVGTIYGIKTLLATNPQIEAAEGTYSAAGTVYSTVVTGANSYGVPALAGNTPASPKMVVVDTPDSANPLNQFITIGWKVYFAALILNPNFGTVIRHRTAYA